MKKRNKLTISLLLVLILCCTSISAFAQSKPTDIGLKTGDVLVFDDGNYTVYLDEDGQAHLSKDGIMLLGGTCPNGQPHQYRVQPGTSVKKTKISNDSKSCYWERTYIRNVCTRCGDTVVSQKSEKKVAHKYKLFGNECQNVVNGKTCGHKK